MIEFHMERYAVLRKKNQTGKIYHSGQIIFRNEMGRPLRSTIAETVKDIMAEYQLKEKEAKEVVEKNWKKDADSSETK